MPFADRAPIDRQPEPFDPNNLRRSVIAVPLREAIEQELDATKEFAEQHAELLKGHSATVFFLGDRPEEIAAARERVLKRLEKAVQELRELKELRDGIERQSIDPLLPELGNRASLASLRGRVISLLLAMDASSDPLTDGGKPAPPAIDHIWPTRFEVIIDINLNFNPPEVVVVVAGNSGYGTLVMKGGKTTGACLDLTINDPGNAECAINVGSTHRDMPYMYGVSYFSSKGPTGDGRCKPDLLAPGEKIVSCAAPKCKLVKDEADSKECNYFETSGTSMAAPHVSGAIAAFLSIRKEFIGEPERVKKIFTSTATDLGRDRYFQGSGLVDLMRAIQSV